LDLEKFLRGKKGILKKKFPGKLKKSMILAKIFTN